MPGALPLNRVAGTLSSKDKDQLGSLGSFRTHFYFPHAGKADSKLQPVSLATVCSKEEMKPLNLQSSFVVPSPAALGLTEAFCYSPRDVYLGRNRVL